MASFGVVSYNIHCNFTNYGSALQSWALCRAIGQLGHRAILVDYCPDCLKDKDPLNPMKNMWDTDEESRRMCELSLPAIRENYAKFDRFYTEAFERTKTLYTRENFDQIVENENLDGFVCGSDTVFCIDEFGFDDGYYANYPVMKNGYAVSYAASFGDAHFDEKTYPILNERLQNFKALAIRENSMLEYLKSHTSVPVKRVVDPTLLLSKSDFDTIAAPRQEEGKYLLLYARRHNPKMTKYAEDLAEKNGWKVIEISLRATQAEKHRMFYEAGVEEFLSLVKHAEFVVTNSFHGMILSVQYRTKFVIFSREQCDNKIDELLDLFGLRDRKMIDGSEAISEDIDYGAVHSNIDSARKESLAFLKQELDNCR